MQSTDRWPKRLPGPMSLLPPWRRKHAKSRSGASICSTTPGPGLNCRRGPRSASAIARSLNKCPRGHLLRLRAIALALRGPRLQFKPGPGVVEQIEAPERDFACLRLQGGRSDIRPGNLFGQRSMLCIRVDVDGEEPNGFGFHAVTLNECLSQRRCRRGECSLGTYLSGHDDKPRQCVDDEFGVVKMRRRCRR